MPSATTRIILLMGVAGSGKTTIGRQVASELAWPYFEADDFHSAANKEKMRQGIPLNDDDRAPWLASLREQIDACVANGQSAVFTCSALKEKYRQILMRNAPAVKLVYLAADVATIQARVSQRKGHYMKVNMVQSQFAALEVPADALSLDARESPASIVAQIKQVLAQR